MSSRTVIVDIAINGAFLTRRWEEPESWMRLTRECGYGAHSFCGDVIDPFFSGDRGFQLEQAAAVRDAARTHGITICDYYTGVATHRFHGLSHSDPRPRRRMAEWIERAAEIAIVMGTDALGGHWDAISVETLQDEARMRVAVPRLHATFRELAQTLRKSGIRTLYQEQMYIPSEKPWTMGEAEEFLIQVNRGCPGIPVLLTLDVGHMAGEHYGLSSPDTDYLEWLKRFASVTEVIHLQQTTADASHHWPFTEEYNRRGDVRMESVLQAIAESHRRHHEQPFAGLLAPVERHWLVAEIIPGSTKTEALLLQELTESARYLRQFVPEGGLTLRTDAVG